MVGILRNYNVGQEPCGRDTLVDDRQRRLDQYFALIFSDRLKCAATWAVSTVRLVMNKPARKLRQQRGAVRLSLCLSRS